MKREKVGVIANDEYIIVWNWCDEIIIHCPTKLDKYKREFIFLG